MKNMPDFGTVHENAAAFDVAVAAITSGELAWGRSLLAALRDHICSTGEQKSVQWMLPQVLETLAALKTCPPSSDTAQGGAQGLRKVRRRTNTAHNGHLHPHVVWGAPCA